MSWEEFRASYGPAWENTKRRYWEGARRRPWRRRRCFWCRRRGTNLGNRSGWFWRIDKRLQLNHLTYRWGVGNAPLIVLRPMCPLCHSIETKVTRLVRPMLHTRNRMAYAHAFVTYAGRWILNLAVIIPLVWGTHSLGLW